MGRIRSALQGMAWVFRWGGLRERVERVDAQTARTNETLARLEAAVQGLHVRLSHIETILRARARVRGHDMALEPTDQVVSRDLAFGALYEPLETQVIDRLARRGDVVLDIGANIGYYTLILARRVGESGRVFAFEPDPANVRLLRHNVAANGYDQVTVVPQAVSDRTGPLRLFSCAENRGDHRAYDSGDGRPSIEIGAVALDDFLAGLDRPIALIKMDVQGFEAHALRGMRRLLQREKGVTLLVEFWPIGLRRAGSDARALLQEFKDLGFNVFELDEKTERLRTTTADELIRAFPAEREEFTNLLVTREPYDVVCARLWPEAQEPAPAPRAEKV